MMGCLSCRYSIENFLKLSRNCCFIYFFFSIQTVHGGLTILTGVKLKIYIYKANISNLGDCLNKFVGRICMNCCWLRTFMFPWKPVFNRHVFQMLISDVFVKKKYFQLLLLFSVVLRIFARFQLFRPGSDAVLYMSRIEFEFRPSQSNLDRRK